MRIGRKRTKKRRGKTSKKKKKKQTKTPPPSLVITDEMEQKSTSAKTKKEEDDLEKEINKERSNIYTYPADKVWRLSAVENMHLRGDHLIPNPPVERGEEEVYPFEKIEFSPR